VKDASSSGKSDSIAGRFPDRHAAVKPEGQSVTIQDTAARYAPYVLSIVRIVAALLFFEHGTSRLFGWPSPLPTPAPLSMYWFAGAIELVGGALLALGLFTRPAALIMSGEMAFAYFISHAPLGFFPILNRGDAAILYCFIFLYIAFAGGGPWNVDALIWRKARANFARLESEGFPTACQ
jgi:putative oxidoreductase